MLIIPFYEKTDWKHLPVMTLVLIVCNVLIYAFVQNDTKRSYTDAAQYYFSSKLSQYELPHYLKHLKKHRPELARKLGSPRLRAYQSALIFRHLVTDRKFNRALDNLKIITPGHPNYADWRSKRAHYRVLYHRITSLHFGITPAYNSLSDAFTYMFLHGSNGHLIGNMFFLLILGFALEKALGKLLFTVAYLASGMLAAELFAITSTATNPTIGASGAISGLMGLFTVVFGLRKINFFYWVVFYFDYVRAPAIALLPVWIGHEIYQMMAHGTSNVNYMVHLGGLISGALIALAYRKSQATINDEFIDQEEREDKCRVSIDQAMQAMASLDYTKAAALFRRLHRQQPDNIPILEHYHTVLSRLPVNEAYHKISLQVLAIPAVNMQQAQTLLRHYKHYLTRTGTSAQLNCDLMVVLAKCFTRYGLIHESETIINTILKHRPEHDQLPGLLMILANSFYKLNQEDKQIMYLSILVKDYTVTEEAYTADKLLRDKPIGRYQYH